MGQKEICRSLYQNLTDSDGENSETDTWLDFAMDCGYISKEHHRHLIEECQAVGAMLGAMIKKPERFLLKHPLKFVCDI